MAVEVTPIKYQVKVLLNNGTTATGNRIYATVALPTINKDAWDAEKASNIVNALTDVMSLEFSSTQVIITNELED